MIFPANKIAGRRRRKESDPELPLGLGLLSLRERGARRPWDLWFLCLREGSDFPVPVTSTSIPIGWAAEMWRRTWRGYMDKGSLGQVWCCWSTSVKQRRGTSRETS